MSVLIKGMKMPTSCLKGGCPLDGFACQLWEDKYWSRVESPEKMRHKNCPLIELPDHGDLIDMDEFSRAMYHEAFEVDSDMQKWESGCWIRYKMFERLRDSAPVVIPEERE